MQILFLLFYEFFRIALFTVGGGLAMIPVIENTFVKKHNLLNQNDILDMVGITQTIPGLIAVNSAVFVGQKLAGWKGAVISTIGVILPSMILIMIIAAFFPLENLSNEHLIKGFQCVRSCVLGLFLILIFRFGKKLLKSARDFILLFLLLTVLFSGINSVFVVISACVIGSIYETYFRVSEDKK